MIRVKTFESRVEALFVSSDGVEVLAIGDSLTEAVENLVIRFRELQESALEELYARGFIRVEKGPAS